MTPRPLHAVLLPPAAAAARLLELLPGALDGTGPALLPLDPALPASRLGELLDAFAPARIETAHGTERLARAGPAVARQGAAGGPGDPSPVAIVIATSGSAGQPKAAELSAGALLASARASLDRIGARPGERWLCCLPVFHVAGLQVLVRSLLAGTEPVVTARLDAAVVAASGCAHASMVPTQLRRLLAAGGPLAPLRTILVGGAAVPAGLAARAAVAGPRMVTTYGMSETCGGCVYDREPLDGVQVQTGPGGVIRIAGPVLFSGYRCRPDLTAAVLRDGWLVTSDLGSVDAAGRLDVLGRADDVIITGAEKVAAGQVEAVLGTYGGVSDVAVIGMPDPDWGERVTAVVVPADPAVPPLLEALREHVSDRLPAWAAPRAVVFVARIPLLASGKPDRRALRRLAGAQGLTRGARPDPGRGTEPGSTP